VGYRVYPVNPLVQQIDGQSCYPSLEAIPEPVDIVNVFRHPDYLPEIVESAIAIQAATLWTQLKIYHPVAEKKAIEAGLNVIMDACIQIEYQRLFA
jgi:predicted CoA-binding protein